MRAIEANRATRLASSAVLPSNTLSLPAQRN